MYQHTCRNSIAVGQNKSRVKMFDLVVHRKPWTTQKAFAAMAGQGVDATAPPFLHLLSAFLAMESTHCLVSLARYSRRILAGAALFNFLLFGFFRLLHLCNGCVKFVCEMQFLRRRVYYWRSSAFHLAQLYQQSECVFISSYLFACWEKSRGRKENDILNEVFYVILISGKN